MGKARISPSTALAFEKVFHRPAHFWLNLQTKYDEARARQQAMTELHTWGEWTKRFPVAAMRRFRLLEASSTDDASTTSALLSFFGVSSPESWRSLWETPSIAYRQTMKFTTNIEAISAWARAAEIETESIRTALFDEDRLKSLIPELRKQTREGPDMFVPEIRRLCASAGVAVVWVPELPQTGISGCSWWMTENKSLIALTLRYKADDQIWFTFFHELGHILMHKKKQHIHSR